MPNKTLIAVFINIALILIIGNSFSVLAQGSSQWTPQQNVPGYWHETEPPYLIADQNNTVHAFTSQLVSDENPLIAVFYNQWTADQGWSIPVDILLSPIKNQARILGAYMDQSGIFHILFFGGDNTQANIYYAKAPAANADQASAWSAPVKIADKALDPQSGAIAGDGQGNLVVLYSGKSEGNGVYTQFSADSGETWSDPVPVILGREISNQELFPFYIHMHVGQSGKLYAVWSMNDIQNHGQGIYFSRYNFLDQQWSVPMQLAETQGNLGTQVPVIIEYEGSLFVMYYSGHTGNQYFTQSEDGGFEWSEPVPPFPHVGLNGPGSFVVDANDDLHYIWAQRITGNPTRNGAWHSTWLGNRWSAHETIVSGLKVIDLVGDTSFDPNTTRAVAVQGNQILVTWRTDRGSKGNGVWYSHKELDAPQPPVVALPTSQTVIAETQPASEIVSIPDPTQTPAMVLINDLSEDNDISENSPTLPLVLPVISVVIVISAVILTISLKRNNRR